MNNESLGRGGENCWASTLKRTHTHKTFVQRERETVCLKYKGGGDKAKNVSAMNVYKVGSNDLLFFSFTCFVLSRK